MSAPTFYLAEFFKNTDATAGIVTTNGGVTGQWVSAKTLNYLWLELQLTQAVSHATVITVKQATAVAGTGTKTGPTCNIWLNEATATNDTDVKQTSGTSVTVATGVNKKHILIGIDPSSLDVANGFDVVGFSVSDSSQATNFVSGMWHGETKYPQATPPTLVLD